MTDRTASLDATCPPDGGGCNDLTATTQRHEFGAGVTVLHWPCGHAHVHIATSTDVKVHAPDKSHERRFWHPADTRDLAMLSGVVECVHVLSQRVCVGDGDGLHPHRPPSRRRSASVKPSRVRAGPWKGSGSRRVSVAGRAESVDGGASSGERNSGLRHAGP